MQLVSPPYVVMPRWSPDGTQVVFIRGEMGKQSHLSIVPRDGGNARDIYVSKNALESPSWSPDAKRIFFGEYSEPYSTSEVVKVLNLETGNADTLPDSKGLSQPVL